MEIPHGADDIMNDALASTGLSLRKRTRKICKNWKLEFRTVVMISRLKNLRLEAKKYKKRN